MHHFTHRNTPWPARGPLVVIQVNNTFRHSQGHPKTTEKNTPNSGSHIAMKKEVVYRLLISLAHAIYVHHDDVPPPNIIQSEDLA
jgi:hypothetical protein